MRLKSCGDKGKECPLWLVLDGIVPGKSEKQTNLSWDDRCAERRVVS